MNSSRQKAFTLTELLVVVIVLGTLAAVAVPKFSRVLESRKTTEAEEMFAAVRTEQEYRCSFGKNYQTDKSQLQMLAGKTDGNYIYGLTGQGITATSNKGYSLKMLSYRDGRICCDGDYCDSLNKNYPKCSSLSVTLDECAGEVIEEEPPTPCEINPNSCECNPNQEQCCTEDQKWDGSQCVAKTFCDLNPDDCTCNPKQEKCCSAEQKWDGSQCVAKTFCELNPDDCSCNPNQAKCCSSDEEWNSATGQCEEKCTEGATQIASFYVTDLLKGKYTDTCDSAPTATFKCSGSAKKCYDIRPSGIKYVQYLVTCCGDEEDSSGGGSTCQEQTCPGGMKWNPISCSCQTCLVGFCPDGQKWNSTTCQCEVEFDRNPTDPVNPGDKRLTWQCENTSMCQTSNPMTGSCSYEGQQQLVIGEHPIQHDKCYVVCTCHQYAVIPSH